MNWIAPMRCSSKLAQWLPEARMERTLRKQEHQQKEAVRYRSIEQQMDKTGETQVSFSDPDARSMTTTARMPRIVGYNVQTAVEADNHLIVAHDVTMLGFDRDALSMMAVAARDAMTTDAHSNRPLSCM
ncbi:hypothetical protein OAN307_c21910 [Octadecabacter antarcticus 307]|uniref:Uncharacterized protein n=1 Tax=Octadecabacter antarcticus 307 TaxID=391626 RepID=M9R584_9RHOB|nr:hypothetical protein OAN307_c21910 [Octadecabacter antarcticus 307]